MEQIDNSVQVQLPRWKCHKEVYADRIREIQEMDANSERASHDDSGLRWILDCAAFIVVTNDLIARGQPQVGDYFVQYDDGYLSWSPAKPFEDGYTRI